MLAFVAALILRAPDTSLTELHRADASYAQLDPYPTQPPGDNLREVLQAYQDIIAEHGLMPGAEAGAGKCLFLLGRYQEAANAFRLGGARYRWRRDEASVYADVCQAIDRQTQPFKVRQLRHVPGIDRWVAVLNSAAGGTGRGAQEEDVPCKLAVYRKAHGTNRVDQVGKTQDLDEFWTAASSTLYLVRLSNRDRVWRLLFFREGRGDCSPCDVRILSVVPSGLSTIQEFTAYEGAWVRGPSASHGLLVSVGPAWKLAWTDLYEWTGERFALANRRFPRFFKLDHDAPSVYTDWMTRAAELDIHGRFEEAEFAWKSALRTCRMSLHAPRESPYHDSGHYGDTRANLKEIAQRLAWLRRHQYNHALLYRPIDWGLQVPPHKLGNAMEDDSRQR